MFCNIPGLDLAKFQPKQVQVSGYRKSCNKHPLQINVQYVKKYSKLIDVALKMNCIFTTASLDFEKDAPLIGLVYFTFNILKVFLQALFLTLVASVLQSFE